MISDRGRAAGFAVALMLAGLGCSPADAADAEGNATAPAARLDRVASGNLLQLGVGPDYSTGQYGDIRDTKVTAIVLSAKYVTGHFTFKVSAPYIHLEGPGTLVTTDPQPGAPGGGGEGPIHAAAVAGASQVHAASDVIVAPGGPDRVANGFGDVVGSMTYAIDLVPKELFLDLTGKVKLPTASASKRLGTGRADFIAETTLTKVIGPANSYVEPRRRFAGDSAAFPVHDAWGVSTGVAFRATRRINLGLDYDWQQSAFVSEGPSSEITGSATFKLRRSIWLQSYATVGLNANSVGQGAGLRLLWRMAQ